MIQALQKLFFIQGDSDVRACLEISLIDFAWGVEDRGGGSPPDVSWASRVLPSRGAHAHPSPRSSPRRGRLATFRPAAHETARRGAGRRSAVAGAADLQNDNSWNEDIKFMYDKINKKRFYKPETSHLDYTREKNQQCKPNDEHPNEEGHKDWAKQLLQFINANNLRTI